MVIDADGLHHVTHNHDLVAGYSRVVLTPNHNELSRLAKKLGLGCRFGAQRNGEEWHYRQWRGLYTRPAMDALVIANVLDLLCCA